MAAPAGAAPPDEAASGVPPRGLSNPASGGGEPAADTDGSGCPQPKGRPQDALATASPGLDGSLPASEGGRRSRLTLGQRLGRTPPDRASSGRASAGTGLLQRSHSLSSMGLAGDSPAAGAETGRDTASKTHGRSIGGSLLSFSTDVSARERSPSYRRLFADRSTRDWLTSQYAAAARVSAVPTATARRVGGPSEGGRPRSADACGEEETGAAGASTRRILPQECDTLAEEEAARLEELVKVGHLRRPLLSLRDHSPLPPCAARPPCSCFRVGILTYLAYRTCAAMPRCVWSRTRR